MIIVLFLKVVYTLKYPSNAFLSNLDNGLGVYIVYVMYAHSSL